MLNIEKYKDEIKAKVAHGNPLVCVINELMGKKCEDNLSCNHCYSKVLDWLFQEYKESILTSEEKSILSEEIKRFGKPVYYVIKELHYYPRLFLVFYEQSPHCSLEIPYPNKEHEFNNMEFDRKYTLEELGL